jgi:ribosomal protein S27AE
MKFRVDGIMSSEQICHECGVTAFPADRYCGGCGLALIEPAATWPSATSVPKRSPETSFIPLDLPPDIGAEQTAKRGWFGGLLRSRSA